MQGVSRMRYTVRDYIKILELCKTPKTSDEISKVFGYNRKSIYKHLAYDMCPELLIDTKDKHHPFKVRYQAKEGLTTDKIIKVYQDTHPRALEPHLSLEEVEKIVKDVEIEDVKKDLRQLVEDSTTYTATGKIVKGFNGFHGGDGKRARTKVHVGSTAEMI